MATRSAIEWTEMTWNPVTGCSKVSPGCRNCYAERMSRRLHAMGAARYARGFELTTHDDALDAPLHWKAPRKVFVNSMSDLFHKDVPFFFKQWGGIQKHRTGRALRGRTYDEMPRLAAAEMS